MWADFWFPRVVDLRGSAPIDELGLQYLLSHLLGCSDWDRLSRALLDLDLWGARVHNRGTLPSRLFDLRVLLP